MDRSPFKLDLYLSKESKIFDHTRESILKLVELPSLVAKSCKIRKIYEVCKFCIFLYYARKSLNTKWPKFTGSGKAFRCIIQKYTKFANFVYFSYFTTLI